MREIAYYEAKFEALNEVMAADPRVHLINGTFLSLSPRREEFQNLSARELPPENHRSIRRRAMRLKHILGQVQSDDANLFHGRPLCSGFDTTTLAHWMPSGASTPSVMERRLWRSVFRWPKVSL